MKLSIASRRRQLDSMASGSQGGWDRRPLEATVVIAPVADVVAQISQFAMRDACGMNRIPKEILIWILNDLAHTHFAVRAHQCRFSHVSEAERPRWFEESLEQAEGIEADDGDSQLVLQDVQFSG